MPPNAELFAEPALSITVPDGLRAPRLWVRRLKIWESPGGDVIRDIELRPGLNIIWSPDGDDDPDSETVTIGHGSGKTLFCRLLRYCLGETRFADEVQRDAISSTLLNGVVGAEVMLDGVCWAVARPLGVGRKHFAIAEGDLDQIALMEGAHTGMDPLIDAIEASVIGENTASLARLGSGQKAWPIALAWASRDQECRFDHVLDWRSSVSGSDSPQPASGDAKGPRLLVLRALLNALTEEEQTARAEEQELTRQFDQKSQLRGRLEWEIGRRVNRLVRDLGLEEESLADLPLLVQSLKTRADQAVAGAAQLPDGESAQIANARQSLESARSALRTAEVQQSGLTSSLPVQERLLAQYEGELPNLQNALVLAETAVCPTCERPVAANDQGQHDIETQRQRLAQKQADIASQKTTIQTATTELDRLKAEVAAANQRVNRERDRVRRLETAADQRRATWRKAVQHVEDVRRCEEIVQEIEQAKVDIRDLDTQLKSARDGLRSFENKQAKTFGDLSRKFSAVIRELLGDEAKGSVALTGKGLDVRINVGGDRRSAATESLKVIAFDLACLCRSIEGHTRIPAFLLHDSPREADLGRTIYDKLFELIRRLESELAGSVFQYIITTTSRPPDSLISEPWLREKLRGEPGDERLLRRDL